MLLNTILPIIYRYAIVSTEVTSSLNVFYSITWGIWVYSYLLLYGLLLLLWPITYFNVRVITDFYLVAHWWGGVWGGIALYGFIAFFFLISALTGGSWLWFLLYFIIEPAFLTLSFLFHDSAAEWYSPKYVLASSKKPDSSDKDGD